MYDSRQEYYVNSANFLDRFRSNTGLPHLIHLALDATFRSAHRQHNFKDAQGRNLINEVRNFRNRNWWDAVKQDYTHKRKRGGLAQRNQANATEHEDIINDILGRDWDATGTNKKQWIQHCRNIATTYYNNNDLPQDDRPHTTHA